MRFVPLLFVFARTRCDLKADQRGLGITHQEQPSLACGKGESVTDITLKEYVEQWIRGHEKIHEAQGKALDAALESANEKAERHNDLIHASERKEASYITRGQFDAQLKPITDFIASQQGARQGSADARNFGFSIASIFVSLSSLIALVVSLKH
jgi:hypothetical protein